VDSTPLEKGLGWSNSTPLSTPLWGGAWGGLLGLGVEHLWGDFGLLHPTVGWSMGWSVSEIFGDGVEELDPSSSRVDIFQGFLLPLYETARRRRKILIVYSIFNHKLYIVLQITYIIYRCALYHSL